TVAAAAAAGVSSRPRSRPRTQELLLPPALPPPLPPPDASKPAQSPLPPRWRPRPTQPSLPYPLIVPGRESSSTAPSATSQRSGPPSSICICSNSTPGTSSSLLLEVLEWSQLPLPPLMPSCHPL